MRHPDRSLPCHHRSRGEASVTGTTGPERQGETAEKEPGADGKGGLRNVFSGFLSQGAKSLRL